MARKHRKLFPALTDINQTLFCSEFCYPTCSYNCVPPFPEDYYFPPPPPPPPSPSDAHHSKQILHNSPYLIIALSLLASFLLLVSYYVFIARSGFGWCRRRNNRPAPSQLDGTDEESLDENQVDHPIWFITTVGLQQSVISSISVCKYKKEEGLVEGTECSVCLNEFQEDETLRLLPKCNHAFHIPCIDTWLRSHTNCPLCRANIVTDTVTLDIVRHPLASVDQNANNLDSNEATQMMNTGIDAENRAGTEEEGESQEVNGERTSKEGVNSSGNRVFQVLGDPTDAHQDVGDGIQPVRRSVSMDSSLAAEINLGLANFYSAESEGSSVSQIEVAEKDGEYSSVHRLMANSSIEQCLHIRPVSMKRSFSSGGRILSSRHNRSLNSILSF